TQHTRARDFESKTPKRKTRFNLTVESPNDGNQHVRFKRLLKLALRSCGLRAVDYAEMSTTNPPPETTPPTPAPCEEGTP
ncbi:MAG: hypothetical protein WC058_13525, partial [Phycisphaeraceae bacterium]